MFLREHAGGHSTGAYYLAKNMAALPRLTLAALHFSSAFTVLARPVSPFRAMFALAFGLFFGVYGLAIFMSMLVGRSNSALLGTIAGLIVACLCGFGPSLEQGREWGLIYLQDLLYSRWGNEYFLDAELASYSTLFLTSITESNFGYTLGRASTDFLLMLASGLGLRVLAYLALLLVARSGSTGE